MQIDISQVRCFESLGAAWRALEPEVARLSFFQSWTWLGCLAAERYADPVLLTAIEGGRTRGLALFNRSRGRLCLAEAGMPALDAPFIEHNAPLVAGPDPEAIATALLRAAWGVAGVRGLVLSGVAPALAAVAGGRPWRLQQRRAPFVDLAAIRAGGGDWLATRSANTRAILRRSARAYAARGALRLEAAGDVGQALEWFAALERLHTKSWQDRGLPGAFSTDFLRRFHRALIAASAARGELAMLRAASGDAPFGYLYNFRLGGRVQAYQSGLDQAAAPPHGKPGLTSHALAIAQALDAGDAEYDFLAGDARYKTSLATNVRDMAWAELVPARSARGLVVALRRWAGR